VPAIAGA
jgi:uncharacterized membrane protein YgcG